MLFKISLLTSHIFSVLYPLCFLISAKDPLKNNFHKFHLGLPVVIGSIVSAVIFMGDFALSIKCTTALWIFQLVFFCWFYWNKSHPNPFVLVIPIFIGLINFIQLQSFYISSDWKIITAGILAGMVFTASMYAMNLGHFYLNVHGLPVKHLIWSTHVFLMTLILRLLWDLIFIFQLQTLYKGEMLDLFRFMGNIDGVFLLIGIFFGTLFPLGSLYFAYGTLKLKNTQATTGILYVILSAILLGDLTYKFYLIRYGIPL